MKVLYLVQTHQNPSQIKRLVSTIKNSSPASQVLISHDNRSTPLNNADFKEFSGVNLIYQPGGRGDFYIVQSYLNSLKWLFEHQIEFDWIVNLSGQDYPTQPLPLFEEFLSKTKYDGFLEYRDVLSENGYYGLKESRIRYFYQYWHTGMPLSQWQRALIKPIKVLVNNTQPFVQIGTSYQLSLGIRDFPKRFDTNFKCYGGSFFKILSNKCAKYLYKTAEERVDLVEFYKKSLVADESFMQTILANSNLFNLCDKNYFYINWKGTKHGRPKILTVDDYSSMTKGEEYYFARKFDPKVDSQILDLLDQRIFRAVAICN
ncbi:MAG: beta-1,6-N-acetylglucosaminyltransferase [Cyanobacteriota bacterium]